MADGKLWLLTDQAESWRSYEAWLKRWMPTPRAIKHRLIDLHRSEDSLRRKLGAANLEGLNPQCDRLLVLMDWEDDVRDPEIRTERGRATEAVRRWLCERLDLVKPQVQAFLVPPTTEAWYLLLAHDNDMLRDQLDAFGHRKRSLDLNKLITARWLHATHVGAPAPLKEDVDRVLGVARSGRKKMLTDVIVKHVGEHPPADLEALPPCLRGLARWLDAWP